jgi:Transcriptional regulatory protein, C terminal
MTDSPSEQAAAWSFAFGPFVLVPKRQLLLENGRPVRVGGRALDILTVLVGRAGDLVSKRELLALVWPNTVVEEGNLKVNMAVLRRILHEAPDMPAYIATVAGKRLPVLRKNAGRCNAVVLEDAAALLRSCAIRRHLHRRCNRGCRCDRVLMMQAA